MVVILIGVVCIVVGAYLWATAYSGLKKYDREFEDWLERHKTTDDYK